MKTFLVVLLFACTVLSQVLVNNPSQAQLDANDNNVLRFALTLENLESTFYNQFQQTYNQASFFTGAGYAASVFDNFNLIQQHENAHVALLQATLQARTGATLPVCVYDFSTITTIQQYVGAARLFENVGTTAYDGAIRYIYNTTLQQAGATIATIEGRQAAYLNTLAGTFNPSFPPQNTPFPQAFETANAPQTIASLVMPFIKSCPYNVSAVLPQNLTVIPVTAPTNAPANPTADQVFANDIKALNYALTLEYLEATYYNQFLNNPINNQAAFIAAGYTQLDYSYFLLIKDHENAHVTYLVNTINRLGGTPVTNCTYNFASSYTNVSTFVGTAQVLENTGVYAYDGATNRITSPDLRQAAATVATIEARHAAYLNVLKSTPPFPQDFDTALDPATVIQTVQTAFIVSCPYTPVPPNPIFVFPYSNGTAATTTTTTTTTTTSTSTTKGSSSSSTTRGTTGTTSSAANVAASLCALVVLAILAL